MEELNIDKIRFEAEMDFVQCLANPDYLTWLAQQKTFENPAFIRYLEYLQYWKRPEYISFLMFPQCLFFLDKLLDPQVREALKSSAVSDIIKKQQDNIWSSHNAKQVKDIQIFAKLLEQHQALFYSQATDNSSIGAPLSSTTTSAEESSQQIILAKPIPHHPPN
ncbi:putative mediator of RNA polymerase II transcription subunit 31 [Monocercomonoides exilis]|uniref:putative mediator of RNA polymerase II transcription subunit 31 n=1 Tax=Monocercomonoides exilis TaxID=2049356 RepID=UPI003559AF22|nr:putative mediator of RNA polymerase II transcription subunit 31 [Monocercomonoides exilis]|eukprot:MONOS_209.1-p1 / transcript=MONOS_209.1 / gene=MONOS_209 / organism=Monocercomonoides_exilis_PA203 / gene_product=mediator of RNA polymerase II transcription subunit 31 / transcript_product=mediator of RNA polymerase II transcription subunit 31 / location=Mono_scaffold00003:263543-264202(-) / protein_length=163 / sequence_SO=supercontig / SO=protein_coding / is_pseudo=false